MRDSFLPFTRPSITEAEIKEVTEALRSGWITSGPRVAAFEKEFSTYVGAPFGIALSSATAGFHILLQALGIGPGQEVITASLTWPSPANMVELLGAQPVFADIDRRTFQLDPASVEQVITPRTRAIIPVHFTGQPCDLDVFQGLCEEHGLILIEDAAHAIGTEYRGKRIGSGKNPAVFSFHAIKNLTTGEGGLITVFDEKLRDRLISLRFHGVDQDAWKRYAGAVPSGYDLVEPGWKYNLTDLQAALGLVQLRRIEEMNSRRRKLAELYDRLLDDLPEIIRPARVPYPSRHSWHIYTILIDPERTGLTRDEFREEMRKRKIGTGLHFLAVHELSYYRKRYHPSRDLLKNSEYVAARIVSLPLFPDMQEEDVVAVVEEIRDVLYSRRR
ncbi:MAG: aminotransferase class I/II-fold pyridoxal phosphate-dependent enzyme [Syntrophaceae bacterium]|nr:aminotransferase class I/II-fold pyridoxal phosphate-dependent enzyme [Syntrophaceae bacterium]